MPEPGCDIFLNRLFEGKLPELEQPPGANPSSEPPSPEVLSILRFLSPGSDDSEFILQYQKLLANQAFEAGAAVVGLAMAAICAGGRDFSRLEYWYKEIPPLLRRPQLTPAAQAFLLLQQALVEMIALGNPRAAAATFLRQRRAAEQAGSSSLQLLGAAWHAYCFTWTGDLAQAEIIIKDAAPLLSFSTAAPAAVFQYLTSSGMIRCLCGDPAAGLRQLTELSRRPAFVLAPAPMQLLTLGHLLDACTLAGNLDQIEETAARLRQLAIPTDNDFHRSYLHFALGMAALSLGRPHKALRHSEEANLRAGLCRSPIPQRMGALLHGMVLADLGRREEALRHFEQWLQPWRDGAFYLIAAFGYLEISALKAGAGEYEPARLAWRQAHALLPPGERMPQLYRPRSFHEKLAARLFPVTPAPPREVPVRITTLGDFAMEINRKRLCLRSWRGRQSRNLLFALIVHDGQKIPREQLSALLWPDSDGDLADNNLNVTLSRLRRVGYDSAQAPPPWLAAKNRRIWLDRELCQVDALEFRNRLTEILRQTTASPALAELLESYTGPFLPNLTGWPWIDNFRDQLTRLYAEGVMRLTDELLANDQSHAALKLLTKAGGHAPLHEDIWARHMQIYLENDEAARALAVYRQAAAALAAGMGVKPGARLQEMARQASNRPARQVWTK